RLGLLRLSAQAGEDLGAAVGRRPGGGRRGRPTAAATSHPEALTGSASPDTADRTRTAGAAVSAPALRGVRLVASGRGEHHLAAASPAPLPEGLLAERPAGECPRQTGLPHPPNRASLRDGALAHEDAGTGRGGRLSARRADAPSRQRPHL